MRILFTLALLLIGSSINLALAAGCEAILQYGLWDNVYYSNKTKSSDRFHDWWCSEREGSENMTRDQSLGIGYKEDGADFNLKGTSDKTDYSSFKNKACDVKKRDEEIANNIIRYSTKASEAIVSAWKECTANGILNGTEFRGVRAWVEYPADPTQTRVVNLKFGYRPVGTTQGSAEVTVGDLENLTCPELQIGEKFTVTDPPTGAHEFRCLRGNDGEAWIDFQVDEVPSSPVSQIYLPVVNRQPVKRPYFAGINEAVCINIQGKMSNWEIDKKANSIIGKSSRNRAGTTDKLICTWHLPEFVTSKAIFQIGRSDWESNSADHGNHTNGGAHYVVMRDENSKSVGSLRWHKKAKPEAVAGVVHKNSALLGEFNSPTRSVAIEFRMRDSWSNATINWKLTDLELYIPTEDQQY